MNKHKVEQRRLVFKGREFHFVSYEGQVANAARAIPGAAQILAPHKGMLK